MASAEGKEREVMNMNERDRISELPDCILIHIMNFMETKPAVQTCVLAKRWKNLWKSLTNISFNSWFFKSAISFNNFVSGILSSRDASISLLSLYFFPSCSFELKFLNRVMEYAVSHNIHHLTIDIILSCPFHFQFRPSFFASPSLTFLHLSIGYSGFIFKLPKTLKLPSLKTLHLENVCFSASHNDFCADPFSICNLLNTLILHNCFLDKDVMVLRIYNSNLSSLNVCYSGSIEGDYKIVLSTPNLTFLTIVNFSVDQLSSACKLSSLEEVNIEVSYSIYSPVIVCMLQEVFSNVKKMTISSSILGIILDVLSNRDSVRIQPPCFVRLESLILEMTPHTNLSYEDVKRIAQYLIQNSLSTRVNIVKR